MTARPTEQPGTIRYDTDTWLVMRRAGPYPTAVVRRVTATTGEPRFLVYTWEMIEADRRMVGIYPTLDEAVASVPLRSTRPPTPPLPSAAPEIREAWERRRRASAARIDRLKGVPAEVVPLPTSEAWD